LLAELKEILYRVDLYGYKLFLTLKFTNVNLLSDKFGDECVLIKDVVNDFSPED